VQHGSPQPVSIRPFVSKNIMTRRTIKGRPNRANDEAVTAASPRKQSVTSDDRGQSGLPQLEASPAGVIASLSSDSHSAISKALRAYERFVVKEYRNIHANQQKIEEAQHQIKKSQLNIERAQKSLVDNIIAVVSSNNTDEVRVGTSPRDIRAAKRRAEVSLAIFYVSHSTVSAIQFLCQLFYILSVILCLRHFFMSAIL
jgi:hypothetical protein